jgi:predicted ArsR family transcriptional regulator
MLAASGLSLNRQAADLSMNPSLSINLFTNLSELINNNQIDFSQTMVIEIPAMKKLSSADQILHLIKTRGPQTAQSMATMLSMTSMGARQHLQKLKQKGLIRTFDISEKIGRPARYWALTETAERHFPNGHGELAAEMVALAESVLGEQALAELLKHREKRQCNDYRLEIDATAPLADQVQTLAAIRSREGYMAEVEVIDEHTILLVQNHCPVREVSQSCPAICQSELSLFNRCLDADIERTEYCFDGDRRCSYRIGKTKAEKQMSLL